MTEPHAIQNLFEIFKVELTHDEKEIYVCEDEGIQSEHNDGNRLNEPESSDIVKGKEDGECKLFLNIL
jgi:hypothetical protein